jgi:hypothetical protein
MVLLVTHPDYLLQDAALLAYERFLHAYRDDSTAWAALPREVSDWWRRRAATSLRYRHGRWEADGPAAADAVVAFIQPGPARA